MIDLYNSKNSIKEEENLKKLLDNCLDEEFIEIKLHLLRILGRNIECFDTYLGNEKIEKRAEKTFHFIQNIMKEFTDEKSVENFKQEIIKRIKQLAKLSSESLIELVNDWFDNNHFLILEKLENSDDIKLIYVENLLNKYKNRASMIEDEKNNEFYLNLLNTHIDLLCKLKYYNKILPCLKNNQLYPVDYCLKKCLESKVTDASIYLYQSTGNDQEALNLAISELKEIFKKMLENSENNDMEEYNKLIEEHNKVITECINICENSGKLMENIEDNDKKNKENEKMWFSVLQIFYEYIDKIKSMLSDKDLIMSKNSNYKIYLNNLSQLISKDIEDLFEKMYPYTGIKKIISRVSEANKQASSKEFKPVLQKLLKGYGYLDTILTIAKKLLANNTINNLNEERSLIKKGICYRKLICDKCNNTFEENEKANGTNKDKDSKFMLFKCGHKMHKKCCLIKNNLILCNICYEKELSESLSFMNFDNLINNLAKDKAKRDNSNNNEDDFGSQKNLAVSIKKNSNENRLNAIKYKKLDKINKKSFSNIDFMDIDLDNIRRNKRK